ncbi:MAG: cytochrome biosis protein CcmC [Moraxellaceae bacterium]|jgi:cytochrome c-type biogenesis protein CcmE|nr:cytochrome biosis protein CcmC [Moraxellaceae bacterium]
MSFTLTPKRKKTLLILIAVMIGVGIAVGLTLYALRQNLNLFYTPTQLVQHEAPEGQRIQVGGLVMQGSLKREPDSLAVRFTITDLKNSVDVTYTGILPDLFREGQGIVANGRIENGVVVAEEVLAKHDETYMPPQVKHAIEQAGHPAGK